MIDKLRLYGSLLLISIILTSAFIPVVNAQPPAEPHIAEWKVEDMNRVDLTNKTLMAGGVYIARFKIVVGIPHPNETLVLETSLWRSKDVYWSLKNDYPGIDTSIWNPSQPKLTFKAPEGFAELELVGRIPDDYTLNVTSPDYVRHFEKDFTIVKLSWEDGALLDERVVSVTDEKLVKFNSLLTEKSKVVDTTPTDPKFKALYLVTLEAARGYGAAGEVDRAIGLLSVLPSSEGFPAPPQDQSIFLYATIGAVVLVIILVIVAARARSRSDFIKRRVEDQARRLELMLVRLTRIDRSMADEVNHIKDDLLKIGKE